MKFATTLLATAALLLSSNIATACPAGSGESLRLIKKLSGYWESVGQGPKMATLFKVTSGGTAVVETLFPGSDHEMTNMYHQSQERIVMNHYCMLGNQPRMVADPAESGGKLVFKFSGGENVEDTNAEHMHQVTLSFIDRDHIREEWVSYKDGMSDHVAVFEFKRKG